MASSKFEKFYDDVRSGEVDPSYKKLFWMPTFRADGAGSRAPTKRELRMFLGLNPEGGDPRWRERLAEFLRGRFCSAMREGFFYDS